MQTLGWSPDKLAALTWGLGGGLAGLAAVLAAPLTGLSTTAFTSVVTVAALAAALLGGFHSFPLTFVGALVIGVGESLATLYKTDVQDLLHQSRITGLSRAPALLVILVALVIRGRGLPLRAQVADRLPKLGSGQINVKALVVAVGVLLLVLRSVSDSWAQAIFVSLTAGVMILSIVVVTGFAGQISLGQWALAGIGALITGRAVHAGLAIELAIPLGVVLTTCVGLLFALPALRTRGVNLAIVTLALGYTVSEVVFANTDYLGSPGEGGTKIGLIKLFGIKIDAFSHPYRWALVCLVVFVLVGLVVANLRRSATGRRLVAVRANERAAASLGINVFGVKLYAFAVASGIAAVAGILVAFRTQNIQYAGFNVFESVNSVGYAVIGGLGYVLAGAFGGPTAIGGIGSRILEDWLDVADKWDVVLGSVIVLVILMVQHNGIAAAAADLARPVLLKLRLAGRRQDAADVSEAADAAEVAGEPVEPRILTVSGLSVRFGAVMAVNDVSFEVQPGEVVGLIGPNGAGKTTVIDAVTGFVKPSSGVLRLGEEELNRWNTRVDGRDTGLRRSFQSLELFEDLTVEANIRAGAARAMRASWLTDLVWPRREPLTSASAAAIRDFHLADDLGKLPTELPCGRRRLVGIARAVASAPSVLMLDEPAAGLDENERQELSRLIRRLADERGIGVLLVEHDVGLVMSTCDRVAVIDFGRVVAIGAPDEIRDNAAVKTAYLGTSDDDSHSRVRRVVVRRSTGSSTSPASRISTRASSAICRLVR